MKIENYDYFTAVVEDVREVLPEYKPAAEFADKDEYEEYLNEVLWVDDAVTGNGSGSYWFSYKKAEAALSSSLGLLCDAQDDFGIRANLRNPEECDVLIRCYLLPAAIDTVVSALVAAGELVFDTSYETAA